MMQGALPLGTPKKETCLRKLCMLGRFFFVLRGAELPLKHKTQAEHMRSKCESAVVLWGSPEGACPLCI